jgi:catechol-2,3-dioxygenase
MIHNYAAGPAMMQGAAQDNQMEQHTKPDRVHHIALQVKDLGRAVDWYQAQFSSELLYRDDSWALLRFSNVNLALVMPDQHPAHIAFTHPHAEQFGELVLHRDGTRSVYIEDSEGNTVEIMALD